MKEYSATAMIQASPEKIWAILTRGANYSEWDPGTERIEGEIAAGKKITAYSTLSPGRAFPVKVSEFIPGRKMTWRSGMPLGLFKGERTFTLIPQDNGMTQFVLREVFSGPMLAFMGNSIPDMTETFEEFVNGLKNRAEGRD